METSKKASIVIPTKNKPLRLKLILRALENQITDAHEVIIIFDGCTPQVLTECCNIPHLAFTPIHIILEEGKGRAAARNQGIKRAKGEIIIFIDDDRIPGEDFIVRHIKGHRTRRCALLGKRMELKLTDEEIKNWGNTGNLFENIKPLLSLSKVDKTWLKNKYIYMLFGAQSRLRWMSFVTSNVSVKREDILSAGLFDENYKGWGWEDSDMGYNLVKLNIEFINDSQIKNYHIIHKNNFISTYHGECENYKLFCSKRKYDFWERQMLKLHILRDIKYVAARMLKIFMAICVSIVMNVC